MKNRRHMMKMLKAGWIACALILASQTAHATTPCCDWGEVTVGASALLWRVGECDTMYVQRGFFDFPTSTGLAEPQYIDTGWDWGVRVFAALDTGCLWVEGDYLWYEASGSASATRPETPANDLLLINGTPGSWASARGSSTVRYQHATLALGTPFCRTNCCRLSGVALARYLDLDMRMRVEAVDPLVFDTFDFEGHAGSGGAKAGFQGGGIGIGLRGGCDLVCGLDVVGEINLFGFFGTSQTAHSRFVVDPSLNDPPDSVPPFPPFELGAQDLAFDVPSRSCWVPGLDAKIALAYRFECGCTAVTLELGWETHYYFHALHESTAEPLNFFDNTIFGAGQQSAQLDWSQFNSIAFGGPTFGARAEF